ncbi:hypothetical protein GWK08_07125 [Leptobacterium flavescens]|uniref:POTRA domain-containing protein n=1 Tax=Leptobacterium flavescens TaxID=472055 RepID=A0A6P0UIS3_9FLAO|nr:hypothetical protein [Leptobacterium flavescens]NER13205.1 hypothetical protein [Leptobacterium flavescens]
MKKIVLTILLLLPLLVFCQEGEETEEKFSEEKKKEIIKIIEERLEKKSEVKLGTFKVSNEKVKVYDLSDLKGKNLDKIAKWMSDLNTLVKNKGDLDKEQVAALNKKIDEMKPEPVLKIDSVHLDIREGNIYDIRVMGAIGDGEDSVKQLFTNKRPFAISDFNRASKDKWLLYDIKKEKGIFIKDFLQYDYKNGQNFVIDEDTISLNRENKFTGSVEVNNNLKQLIDFRIYSDFLGLLNEESNGIVNFEGNSLFYLFPKNFNLFNFKYTFLLKKIRTSVSYSRFDNDDRAYDIASLNRNSSGFSELIPIIQKSFLKAGGELDIIEYHPYKFASITLYGKARFNLYFTETEDSADPTADDDEPNTVNTTSLSWGLGVGASSKRYANFGIAASVFWDRYQNNNLLEDNILNFDAITLQSEAFFYPGAESNNAVFLRLAYTQGRRDLSSRENFFSFQFGYRAELKINRKKED